MLKLVFHEYASEINFSTYIHSLNFEHCGIGHVSGCGTIKTYPNDPGAEVFSCSRILPIICISSEISDTGALEGFKNKILTVVT